MSYAPQHIAKTPLQLLQFSRIFFWSLRPYVCSRLISVALKSSLYPLSLPHFSWSVPLPEILSAHIYVQSLPCFSLGVQTNSFLIILSYKTFLNTISYFVVLCIFYITANYGSILSPLLNNKILNIRIQISLILCSSHHLAYGTVCSKYSVNI